MSSIYIQAGDLSIGVGRVGGDLRYAPPGLGHDRKVSELPRYGHQLAVHYRPCSCFDEPGELPVLCALEGNCPAVSLITLNRVGRKHPEGDRSRWWERVSCLGNDYAVGVGIDGVDRVQ